MLGIARDRNDIDRVRLMGVYGDGKSEVARQVATHLMPRVAGIVRSHHIPVFLHVKDLRTRRVHRYPVDAVTHFGFAAWNAVRSQPSIDRLPRAATVLAPKCPCSGNGDEDPSWINWIKHDRVHAHAASAWLPRRTGVVRAQSRQLGPAVCSVG